MSRIGRKAAVAKKALGQSVRGTDAAMGRTPPRTFL
jgi:hypothetical protein